jgi:hypothetical protein
MRDQRRPRIGIASIDIAASRKSWRICRLPLGGGGFALEGIGSFWRRDCRG